MTSIQNPYIVGGPVKGQAFYGRDKLIAEIEHRLPNERLLILSGPRRIGKTSILQNLYLAQASPHFTFIYLDSTQIATKSIAEATYYIASQVAKTLKIKVPNRSDCRDENFFQRHFLLRAYRILYPKHLVLIFDDFDVLTRLPQEPPAHGKSLFEFITELIETESQLAVIISLNPGLGELSGSLRHHVRNDRWISVSLLEREAARALIINPADQVTYAPEAVDHIMALTSGHPYFTQLICFEVFNYVCEDERDRITLEDVEAAAALVLEGHETNLDWLWENLTPAERLTLALCAEASDTSGLIESRQMDRVYADHRIRPGGLELQGAVKRLVELEIVRQEGLHDLRFVVELVRRWVASEHPAAAERQKNIALLSDRAIAEYTKGQEAIDLNVAIKHYRTAIEANPNHLEAHLALGAAWLLQGRITEALKVYESAAWLDEVQAREGLERARLAQEQTGMRIGPSRNVIVVAGSVGILVIACLIVGLVVPINGQPLLAGMRSPAVPTREIVSQLALTSTLTLQVARPATVSDTPTATMTPVPATNTPVPAIRTRVTEPPPASNTPTFTTIPIPATHTSTATFTPEPPTDTPTATGTSTPTPRPTGTPSPPPVIPASTSTPVVTPTLALSTPAGTFTLLKPLSGDDASHGPTVFEWEWTGAVPPGIGFEVRVWREGEFPSGVHDAVQDNQNGNIINEGGNRYRFSTDISEAPGVQDQSGQYLWTVALVQISPQYRDLGQQAEPARLQLEAGGGGAGGGGSGGGVGLD